MHTTTNLLPAVTAMMAIALGVASASAQPRALPTPRTAPVAPPAPPAPSAPSGQPTPAVPSTPSTPAIQARPGGPETSPKTDRTVDAPKGTRLVLNNSAGEVVVRTWERDQVRVEASHSSRETVDVQVAEGTLRVRTRSQRGPNGLVDYRVTVPRWMPVNLTGTYLEATIEGTTAEVTVETVHGNVRVVGGSGAVSVRSVEGLITVDKASGRVQATSVNEGIRLSNVTGDMTAETTNGDIVIENAQTSNLEASTVNGDITFNGTLRDNGAYRLTTHGGDVRVGLGDAANATVFVRTFQGDFAADFPIQLPEGQSSNDGPKRFNFTLGSGSARLELQSFNGDIRLARKVAITKEEERNQRRMKTRGQFPGAVAAHAMAIAAEAMQAIDVDRLQRDVEQGLRESLKDIDIGRELSAAEQAVRDRAMELKRRQRQ